METHAPDVDRVFRLAVAPITNVKVRDATGTGDGSWTMEGYAAVFDQETLLYDARFFSVYEKIAHGAFNDVLSRVAAGQELVHLNFGHDMNTSIAATNVQGIGGLELTADSHGLRFFARVDPADPDAVRLAAKMRRGVVGQASFAFTIAAEEMTTRTLEDGRDEDHYTITQVKNLYDVCACPQGAYPQTEASIRSLAGASLNRAGTTMAALDERADIPSLSCLMDMYECGQAFIANETEPDDGPDRDAMQSILDQIETLIEAEAAEPDPGDAAVMMNGRRVGAGRRRPDGGAESTSTATVGGGDGGVARINPRVAVAKAKARALRSKH